MAVQFAYEKANMSNRLAQVNEVVKDLVDERCMTIEMVEKAAKKVTLLKNGLPNKVERASKDFGRCWV